MAFVGLTTARSYVGASAADDALLTILRDGVEAWMARWIPAHLGASTTLTEVLDGPKTEPANLSGEGADVVIREAHRISLSEQIAVDDLVAIEFRDDLSLDWYDHDEESPSDFSGFEVDGYELIRRSFPWPSGDRLIRVQYSHGYAEDSGPADWRMVELEILRALWRTRASQGLRSASIGPMSVSFESIVKAGVSPQILHSIRRGVR